MFALCLTCFRHMLEFVSFVTPIYCTKCFPHVLSVSALYSSRDILMYFSYFTYCLLKDTLLISYSH